MANKKISELDQTLNLSDQADFPLSQDNGGEPTTFRAKLTQIATKIAEAITFSNLKTGNKQLVSAVNQTISNLADDFNTTAGSTYAKDDCVLYNGVLYQCINNSGTTSGTFIDADWTAIKAVDVGSGGGGGGGAGGHTIVDDAGTSLTQRTNLQFKGAYSEDNSTDDTTEINVVREMTKAEFDELTEAEKTGLINITDITGGNDDRFQPVIYSEDEREIGVWVDGKPLYEKTIINSNPSYTQVGSIYECNTSVDFSGVDYFMIVNATALNANSTRPVNDTRTDITAMGYVSIGKSQNNIYTAFNTDGYTKLVFTLRYTKTSDAAGSGQWTPQGVPAHHYSTDEQVVGTWIDGKTLYEKTQYGGISITDTDTWYDTSITGIDKAVMVSGTLLRSGEEVGLGTFNSRWIVRNNTVKISLSDLSGDTWSLMSITVRYTKSV